MPCSHGGAGPSGSAERLGEHRHPQFLQQPSEVDHLGGDVFAGGAAQQVGVAPLEGRHLAQVGGVLLRRLGQASQPMVDGLHVSHHVGQSTRPGGEHETVAGEALELRTGIGHRHRDPGGHQSVQPRPHRCGSGANLVREPQQARCLGGKFVACGREQRLEPCVGERHVAVAGQHRIRGGDATVGQQ